jgi:hypothetical protein
MKRILLLILLTPVTWAGDNHVHVEQVASGDGTVLNTTQIGYDNSINFTFAHANNTFNLSQSGNGNSISWVSYWGAGKSWGGDVDGTNNTESVEQIGDNTYGRHIWGNSNTVDVYQNGTHTHNLDIHANSVEHEVHQSGSGSHYLHTYFYGSTSTSETSIMQKGSGNHNAQIRLQGNYPTTLTLLQDGSTNQSYNLTQNCQTSGGCTLSITQE